MEVKNVIKASIVVLLVLTLGGCSVLPQATATPAKTTAAEAAVGDLVLGLSADGSITLPVTGLDFAVPGIIKNIYVEAGDLVESGQLLAELDDTDLQLALRTAKNNLEKARLSYQEAVANADYNLQNETLNLTNTKEKLNDSFDSYTYEKSIENAKLTLERRNRDYTDTEQSTKLSEESARLAVTRREADLADAVAKVETAKAEVEKMRAELEEAQAELETAMNDDIKDYDDFTAQNNISSAQINADRLKKALSNASANVTEADKALRLAKQAYSNAMLEYEIAGGQYNEELTEPSNKEVTDAEANLEKMEEITF